MLLNAFIVVCLIVLDMRTFFFCLGTWQTYLVKDQSVWHKISKDSPMEYAATITVNPLTALRMLEDFITLNSGTGISLILVFFFSLLPA